jgi:hypothetical protein
VASIQGDIENPALPPEAWETLAKWDRLKSADNLAGCASFFMLSLRLNF